MIVYLKNGSLWVKEYLGQNLVDITSEGEKYLFGTHIDCSQATLGDFLQVLYKNPHLQAIFVEKRKNAYKNVKSDNHPMKTSLSSESQLSRFVDFYGNQNNQHIFNLPYSSLNPLDYLELEVVEEDVDKSICIDFVGVKNNEKYSMSLSPIDNLYYTPLKVKFYQDFFQNNTRQQREVSGQKFKLNTHQFFYALSRDLNELVFAHEQEQLVSL